MVQGTEILIRKFAKDYERRDGALGCYIAHADIQDFITGLMSEFSAVFVSIRKDRGKGLYLWVLASDIKSMLYFTHVRNTNSRGIDKTPVRYNLTIDNKDVLVHFI
jgi:hypothetical protein